MAKRSSTSTTKQQTAKRRASKTTKRDQAIEKTTIAAEEINLPSTTMVDDTCAAYDANLLQRLETQYQLGEWERLCQLKPEDIEQHPDCMKLALLAAAAQFQRGNVKTAAQFTGLARQWGCNDAEIAQVLVAGSYNSLARAKAIQGDKARSQQLFERAVSISNPGTDVKLLAKASMHNQLNKLGLTTNNAGQWQLSAETNTAPTPPLIETTSSTPKPLNTPCNRSLAYYQRLEAEARAGECTPFILLDSKSIPRSGLHYLKSKLSIILGNQFSFCEWYQEPGCCKTMPCSITGFAEHSKQAGEFRLRLTKSHDFELTDPIFARTSNIQQLVLHRDPIFVLTSWFLLDQLNSHESILNANGISMNKIWLAHEKEILKSAYSIIDYNFNEPSTSSLNSWLHQKTTYINQFYKKWINPSPNNKNIKIVKYEEIDNFIYEFINTKRDMITEKSRDLLDEFNAQRKKSFKSRKDPFSTASVKVSEYITNHKNFFIDYADKIAVKYEKYDAL